MLLNDEYGDHGWLRITIGKGKFGWFITESHQVSQESPTTMQSKKRYVMDGLTAI